MTSLEIKRNPVGTKKDKQSTKKSLESVNEQKIFEKLLKSLNSHWLSTQSTRCAHLNLITEHIALLVNDSMP